jgi:hypothetical protein
MLDLLNGHAGSFVTVDTVAVEEDGLDEGGEMSRIDSSRVKSRIGG